MLLVYDHDNVLHITNEKGLRWNYDKTDKPQFGFDYDHLFFVPVDDMYEFELNGESEPLNPEACAEIEEYIKLCEPPLELTMSKQYIEDLQTNVREKQKQCMSQLGFFEFENVTEIMIAGREGSNDPRRQIARRFLDWYDFLIGTTYRICEEINSTLDEDLKDFSHYADTIPEVPHEETFQETHWSDDRFEKTDTLDIVGGQDDLGEDKRAV
tara:strand:+ start:2376 stop:3011 length:636 start_codon:yes stop_codon:yes gene_type:complete